MFRIKICGLTSADDARAVATAGADAVGLNFYRGSKRYIEPAQADAIVAALPASIVKVGVFVDAPPAEIRSVAERLMLDAVQLHGNESADVLAELAGIPVIKAFRSQDHLLTITYLSICARREAMPRMVLLDADVAGAHGGTGQLADWDRAIAYVKARQIPDLVLAGGLTPENVATAIRTVRPAAVDTASGVEIAPGRKDPERIARFVAAARAAFGQRS